MSDHADPHAPEATHHAAPEGAHSVGDVAAALKFEPTEIQDFERADRSAGMMMGQLLGVLFCVLIILMSGVNLWMIGRDSKKTVDPQGPVATAAADKHH